MGRGMVRSAILLVLIWNLAVRASPTTYTMLPLGLLMASPDSYVGRRILTTGIYQVRTQSTYAVDGWLEERQSLIRIVGPIFDWQPVAGIRIDAWGVFRRDGASGELFLDYFNGRRAGDHLRNPRLTSDGVGADRPLDTAARRSDAGRPQGLPAAWTTAHERVIDRSSVSSGGRCVPPLAGGGKSTPHAATTRTRAAAFWR